MRKNNIRRNFIDSTSMSTTELEIRASYVDISTHRVFSIASNSIPGPSTQQLVQPTSRCKGTL